MAKMKMADEIAMLRRKLAEVTARAEVAESFLKADDKIGALLTDNANLTYANAQLTDKYDAEINAHAKELAEKDAEIEELARQVEDFEEAEVEKGKLVWFAEIAAREGRLL